MGYDPFEVVRIDIFCVHNIYYFVYKEKFKMVAFAVIFPDG
jgi:hypothetical protein